MYLCSNYNKEGKEYLSLVSQNLHFLILEGWVEPHWQCSRTISGGGRDQTGAGWPRAKISLVLTSLKPLYTLSLASLTFSFWCEHEK